MQLAHDSDSGGERGGNPAKTTKAIREDGNRIEDKTRIKLEQWQAGWLDWVSRACSVGGGLLVR